MDKPEGVTSHDVVARVRRAVKTRSVGHTGTLDPFATGLLVVLTGRATRLARFVEQQAKTYLATARLGFATTTDDRTGEMIGTGQGAGEITEEAVRAVLASMAGAHLQTPPAYSAKKVEGRRSYTLARRGEEVALRPVQITVEAIELVAFAPAQVTFRTRVSAGTYVRAMARDMGERLGTGAHLEALRREAIGSLRVEDAISWTEIEPGLNVRPVGTVLGHLRAESLSETEGVDVSHGRPVRRPASGEGYVQLVREERVVAVAREDGDWLKPVVVLEGK